MSTAANARSVIIQGGGNAVAFSSSGTTVIGGIPRVEDLLPNKLIKCIGDLPKDCCLFIDRSAIYAKILRVADGVGNHFLEPVLVKRLFGETALQGYFESVTDAHVEPCHDQSIRLLTFLSIAKHWRESPVPEGGSSETVGGSARIGNDPATDTAP